MPFLVRFFLIAVLVCSCAPIPARTPSPSAAPAGQVVLNSLRERQAAIFSFAARGEIILQAKGKEYRGRYTMAAILPDYFLVQISTPANAPVLSIGLHDKAVTAIDFPKGNYLRSRVADGSFPLLGNIWLATDYFSRFPVGNIPVVPSPRVQERLNPADKEMVITLNERGLGDVLVTLVTTDSPPFLVKDIKRSRMGSEDYSVRYRQYKRFGNLYIPFYVDIDIPSREVNIVIRHRDMILNPDLYPAQFKLEPPVYFQEVKQKP